MELSLIIPLFFIIAFLYSSVGHGGASGYLAVMSVMGFALEIMRPTALVINLFVSGIAFFSYYKARYFKFRLLWPLLITSVPTAYAGTKVLVDPSVYRIILGICLLISVLRMIFIPKDSDELKDMPVILSLLIGGIIGFLSGLIGIGGGIMLSPVLIIFGWSTVKEAAAVSAPVIFFNSLSGLSGIASQGFAIEPYMPIMITVSVLGGILGSYLGSKKFSLTGLRYLLACILCLAAFKLIVF